ncbi:ABC transporter ATP-binding protein [Clostridium senegalense]|uniref:ABC transporter ATP-binding protein n=1 Tax=Clostridium senegalense TaxID=1465809 RepID=UPI001C10CCD6|nr:ABC transporter ATP-binding protein [Clostridium senegalense]MBU5225892.1 ABC transporter ATP-binding protein [Clostridium senegalense]
MKSVLEIKNVSKVYKTKGISYKALENIDLQILEGEFVGVMGPSGAGKSTLLNIVSTIDKPSHGQIKIEEKNITDLNNKELAKFRRENLGFIFQDFNLLDTLTVKENIALPLAISKVSVKEIELKVMETCKRLGIEELLNKYPTELSGGQKQRTAAARAIISQPSIILADEPTGALDSKSSKELLNSLERLNEERKATIMMVTHDPGAASYCKRVIFIKDGKLYKEIHKSSTRKVFFQEIIDTMALIGGDSTDDI